MKKSICCCCIVFSLLSAQAQVTKGSVLLGGTLSGSSVEGNWALTLAPAAGIAIRENLVTGISLLYHKRENGPSGNKEKGEGYGAGFFIRKYYPLGKGFYLFLEPSLQLSYSKYTSSALTGAGKTIDRSLGLTLYPGIAYSLNKWLQLEVGLPNMANLQYFQHETHYPTTPSVNQKGFSVDLSAGGFRDMGIGFRFLLAK